MDNKQLLAAAGEVWSIEAEQVSRLAQSIPGEAFCELVRLIAGCTGRVLLAGCGTSAAAAKKIAHSLCCVECPAVFLDPADAVHGGLGLLQGEDVLILVSKGGNTAELLPLARVCREKGARLVAVTENPESKLAKLCDLTVLVKVEREPCPFNMLATASTLAVIALFDAVCIVLMRLTG